MLLEFVPPRPANWSTFDAAAEANHRIANNLSIISGLVRMRASAVCKDPRMRGGDEVRLILEEIGSRLNAVAELHRLLAGVPQEASVDIGDYLRDIAEGVVSSISLSGQNQIHFAADPGCHVPPEKALLLGLVVTELVTNAIKYAHPAGVAGQIRLACRRRSDGHLTIEISDDGVGLPEGVDPMQHGHLGFRLVRSLANQLGAAIEFHSDNLGLFFSLNLPAS
jgi:two-component sensor histidine kinase